MNHWAAKYVGLPYQVGGRDPTGFDCWGLVWWVYKHEFQLELPELVGISTSSALQICRTVVDYAEEDWVGVPQPFDGCAVAMSQGEAFHHVGLYASDENGKVVHCWESHNVIADSIHRLRLKGFRLIHFYRHRLWRS